MKRRYRTSKRPSRIMRQVHIGDTWRDRKTGELITVQAIRPSARFACYIMINDKHYILPPRYFWDKYERVTDADI